jgi:hypothetical protein
MGKEGDTSTNGGAAWMAGARCTDEAGTRDFERVIALRARTSAIGDRAAEAIELVTARPPAGGVPLGNDAVDATRISEVDSATKE